MPDNNINTVTSPTAQPGTPAESQLGGWQKFSAGAAMIIAITLSLWLLIAYWPDQVPASGRTAYHYELMHITLLDAKTPAKPDTIVAKLFTNEKDAAKRLSKIDSAAKADAAKAAADKKKDTGLAAVPPGCTIQFSTLILILVAIAGFLGNMVYISAVLTAFIGGGQFKSSWSLWYFVKPFTASGLALFVYFALNNSNTMNGAGAPINLNGIIAAAALTGLFTDIATQKLKEIFTVVFKPAGTTPDKAVDPKAKPQDAKSMSVDLVNMKPATMTITGPNDFQIPGQNLDPKNTIVNINKKKVDPISVTPTQIKFNYIVEEADNKLTSFPLSVTDAQGNLIASKDIGV